MSTEHAPRPEPLRWRSAEEALTWMEREARSAPEPVREAVVLIRSELAFRAANAERARAAEESARKELVATRAREDAVTSARAFLRRPDSVSSSTHGELLGLVERLVR